MHGWSHSCRPGIIYYVGLGVFFVGVFVSWHIQTLLSFQNCILLWQGKLIFGVLWLSTVISCIPSTTWACLSKVIKKFPGDSRFKLELRIIPYLNQKEEIGSYYCLENLGHHRIDYSGSFFLMDTWKPLTSWYGLGMVYLPIATFTFLFRD